MLSWFFCCLQEIILNDANSLRVQPGPYSVIDVRGASLICGCGLAKGAWKELKRSGWFAAVVRLVAQKGEKSVTGCIICPNPRHEKALGIIL